MNPRVIKVEYLSPYKLILTFSSLEVKAFDFSSYLKYPVYAKLQNENFSINAKVAYGTVVWDDEIDFDPDTLFLEGKNLVSV